MLIIVSIYDCDGGCLDSDGDDICDYVDDCVEDDCGVCDGQGPQTFVIDSITTTIDSVFIPEWSEWVFAQVPDTIFNVICPLMITEVELFETGEGGFDDGWSPVPDPYFAISDANDSIFFVSNTMEESSGAIWSELSIALSLPPYTITFWDSDIINEDDFLGSATFWPDGPDQIDINASPSFGVVIIEWQ